MSIEVEQHQLDSTTTKQYQKKLSKIEGIRQENSEMLESNTFNSHKLHHISSGNSQENNLLANNRSLLITKKLSKLKLGFSSMKRKIDSLTSTINDFQFIVNYIGCPNYSSFTPLSSDSHLQTDVLSLKNILDKKEKKYQAKLAKLKSEKNELMEKKYKLISQKEQFENRQDAATKICNSKIEDLGFMDEMARQIDKEMEFANDIQQAAQLNSSEAELNDESENQITDDKLTTIAKRKEVLIEKLNEIRLMKENYNSLPLKNISQHTYNHIQFHDEEESDGIDYEKYELLIHQQQEIDNQTREIDRLIQTNMTKRKEIENSYEEKIKKVSQLSDKTSEIDRLQIQIHRVNDLIIDAKELLSQNNLTKKRLQRQNGTIANSLEKSKNENNALQKLSLEVQKKQEQVNKRSLSIQNRRKKYEENVQVFERESNVMAAKKADVEKIELKIAEMEQKIEEVNEEIKMQSSFVDKLLLDASSTRADSRINRLQALLDSKSEHESDSKLISGHGFDSKFIYDSPNKY